MVHALDGARLKVVRAQEHLALLKDEIGVYLDAHPYDIVVAQENFEFQVTPNVLEPPPRLSLIVGDCLTNLMAPLDYIVWGLANKYAPVALQPPPIGQDKPSFPLFNDVDRFRKNRHSLQRYQIPDDAINEIEAVQPYLRGYEALWLLYLLVGVDKHRLPVLTVGHIDSAAVYRVDDTSYTLLSNAGQGTLSATDATYVDPVVSTPRHRPPDDVSGHYHYQASVFVAFDDVSMPREPVDRTLEQIVKTVANVIPRFDRFF